MAKKVVFVVSIILNVLFIVLVLLTAVIGGNTTSFSLLNYGEDYLNSAFIVSVPSEDASLSFGPVEISLKVGERALIQFAVLQDGRQSNLIMEPLYDHEIISVNQSGLGIIIRALSPGEAVLQLFSPSGFREVARVTVY